MLEAVGANVEHLGLIDGVSFCVRVPSGVETDTRFADLLFHLLLLLLLPCLGCGCVREANELDLDDLLLGQQELCGPDGISSDCVLPLELLMLDHKQDLLVSRPDKMPRGGQGIAHHFLQIADVVPGNLGGRAHRDGGEHDFDVSWDRQIIVLCPMPCFRQPNLLVRPLSEGLSEAFCFNPPVVDGSASPTPLRMIFACLEEWASARKAEAGSATCCRSWGSRQAEAK